MKMKKHKGVDKVKRRDLLITLACVFLLTAGLVLLFFSLFAVYKVYDIDMELDVEDSPGLNTNTDKLDFGSAVAGNSNSRMIVISHEYKKPLLIHFKVSGNISQFVDAPQDFYLEPGVSKEVTVSTVVTKGAVKAKYTGTMTVYFRRI